MPAVEKYSRFLQPPLPVSAGHDCDGKPETKPKEKTPSAAGLVALSAYSKGCFTPYICLCVCGVWTIGRFGHDTSLFPCMMQLPEGQMGGGSLALF